MKCTKSHVLEVIEEKTASRIHQMVFFAAICNFKFPHLIPSMFNNYTRIMNANYLTITLQQQQ